MLDQQSVQIIVSALAGTAISSIMARWAIMKSLRDLETALATCTVLSEKLAVINEKLRVLDRLEKVSVEHDRKIIALESRSTRRKNGNYTESPQ